MSLFLLTDSYYVDDISTVIDKQGLLLSWHHIYMFIYVNRFSISSCISDMEGVRRMMFQCTSVNCDVLVVYSVIKVDWKHYTIWCHNRFPCQNIIWLWNTTLDKENRFKGKWNDVIPSISLPFFKLISLVALTLTATSLLRSPLISNCSLFTRKLQKFLLLFDLIVEWLFLMWHSYNIYIIFSELHPHKAYKTIRNDPNWCSRNQTSK